MKISMKVCQSIRDFLKLEIGIKVFFVTFQFCSLSVLTNTLSFYLIFIFNSRSALFINALSIQDRRHE